MPDALVEALVAAEVDFVIDWGMSPLASLGAIPEN